MGVLRYGPTSFRDYIRLTILTQAQNPLQQQYVVTIRLLQQNKAKKAAVRLLPHFVYGKSEYTSWRSVVYSQLLLLIVISSIIDASNFVKQMFSSIVGSLTHTSKRFIHQYRLSAKPDIIVSGVVQTNLVNQHCSVGAALNLPSTLFWLAQSFT